MGNIKLVQEDVLKKLKDGEIAPEKAVEQFQRESSVRMKYVPQKPEDLRARYMSDRAIRQQAISCSIPFIHRSFNPDYRLTQGLILVGALSGKSKSTTAANVVAGFLDNSDKRAILINNEELGADAYDRISCIQLKYNFDAYRQGRLKQSMLEEVQDNSRFLMDRLEVVAGDSKYDMTCVEDVIAVLEYAGERKDVGLIELDYYQTVSHSKEHPEWELWRVLKYFGDFMRDYGRKAVVPVVVFAQLKPKAEAAEMQSRIQGDRTIYNQCFSCIEIVPDFDTKITTFIIWKDRFWGKAGLEVQMEYDAGRYLPNEGEL